MTAAIIRQPRSRSRYASRAMPRSSAPVANITVMKSRSPARRGTPRAAEQVAGVSGATTPVSGSWIP